MSVHGVELLDSFLCSTCWYHALLTPPRGLLWPHLALYAWRWLGRVPAVPALGAGALAIGGGGEGPLGGAGVGTLGALAGTLGALACKNRLITQNYITFYLWITLR